MDKYKYLFKNIGLLTISQFGTKILSFFLVPLYTNILTTTEYGTYDLLNTTVSLLVPILTINIVEAALRFTLEKDSDKKDVFSISIKYLLKGSLIFIALLLTNKIFGIVEVINEYWILFSLMFVLSALNGIMICFARGLERIANVAISGAICSMVIISLNILLLVVFPMGIYGYLLANIAGALAQSLYLFISIKGWKYLALRINNRQMQTDMTAYSKPFIANSVAWWINSAANRYIIIWFCGLAANGVFSVASKIPSILNLCQSIFSQAWTLSAVKDFDEKDTSGFFSKMYNSYNFVMVVLCSGLIVSARLLARILYAKDFYEAWQYVPFLLITMVFGALSGYIGGIFFAVKRPQIYAKSTVAGASVNIVLGILFVFRWGAIGAAIATLIAYWVVWLIRVIFLRKYMKIKLYLVRDYSAYGLLVLQSIILLVFRTESIVLYGVEIFISMIIIILYLREMSHIVSSFLADRINRCLYRLFCLVPIKKARIIFESEGDFTDNAQALYNYMKVENYFNKYQAIWLVDDVKKMKKREKVIAASKKGGQVHLKMAYYLATCEYFFYDHNNMFAHLQKRKNQKVIYLSHGVGYKKAKGRSKGTEKTSFDTAIATGDITALGLSLFWACDIMKVQKLGYPRTDYFYSDLSDVEKRFEEEYHLKLYKKVMLWMPTFRKSITEKISENYFDNETGLPLFGTKAELEAFNAFLKDEEILFILKVHQLQAELSVFKEKYSNILILREEILERMDVQLYQFISLTDALITDYSSVSVDYMILDRPIIYTLDDYEEYDKARGIWPENAIDLMRGEHVYSVEELKKAVLTVKGGEDKYHKERGAIISQFHKHLDGNASQRIIEYAGIDKS